MEETKGIHTYTGTFAGYSLEGSGQKKDGSTFNRYKVQFTLPTGQRMFFTVFEPNKRPYVVPLTQLVPGTAYSVKYFEKYVQRPEGTGFTAKNVVNIVPAETTIQQTIQPQVPYQGSPGRTEPGQGSTIVAQAGVGRLEEFKSLYKAENGLQLGKYHFMVSFLAWSNPGMIEVLKKLGDEYGALVQSSQVPELPKV